MHGTSQLLIELGAVITALGLLAARRGRKRREENERPR
jgi:hypothetical protein